MGRRTCVRIGIFRRRALLARPRIPVTGPLPFRRVTWANSSSPGALTLAAWTVTKLVRAVSRAGRSSMSKSELIKALRSH